MGLSAGDLAFTMPNRLRSSGDKAPETLEEIAVALDALPAGVVPVPAMCDRHTEELERELAKALGGVVVSAYLVVSALVFQVATSDPELWAQSADLEQLGRVLTLNGCPSCRYPRAFRNAMRVVRRRGLVFGSSLAKNEAQSSIWRPDVYAVDRR